MQQLAHVLGVACPIVVTRPCVAKRRFNRRGISLPTTLPPTYLSRILKGLLCEGRAGIVPSWIP